MPHLHNRIINVDHERSSGGGPAVIIRGTDSVMLDIEDFHHRNLQLKKEVASLEAKLRERGEDSVWSVRDQRSRDTQDSELSLSLLCYTDAQESVCDGHASVDQTSTESPGSDCNAAEQQTQMKTCSVKLVDCRNTKETREETTAEKIQSDSDDDVNCDDDDDEFIPPDENSSSSDEATASTSKQQPTAKSFPCVTCGRTFSKQGNLARHESKHTEPKDYKCKTCNIGFPTVKERRLHSKEHKVKKEFRCEQCGKVSFSSGNLKIHMKTHTGEKPFHCSECDKHFSTKQSLFVHKRIHTGEKPYKCPHCEKRFRDGSHFKSHMRSH
ncbi:hypothetical protein cypCar_00036691, partial [Cyprinus carpio]